MVRVKRGSITSELLMSGEGVHKIVLLPLMASCIETIVVYIRRVFVFTSVLVTVLGSVGMGAV